jgi:PAS domain S-box-containing protein
MARFGAFLHGRARGPGKMRPCRREPAAVTDPNPYLVSAIPAHQLAELHRLMNEEVEEIAVFFMDPQGVITVWNRAAEVMKGYTAQDAIGSHLRLLYTEEDQARRWPEHNLREAEKHGSYKEESWRKRKDGSRFWARVALTALRDHSGRLLGFSKITLDLTEHKKLELCVKEREHTRRILRAANAGTWTWHPEKGEIQVCENFLNLLGRHGPETTISFAEWMSFVHPGERAQAMQKFERARALFPDESLSMELRMCPRGGGTHWFHVHGEWYREKDDSPYELSGVNIDIQDLKTAEDELRRAIGKLKEADARKDEFLAMLAHELRNPLAPIRSAAEVLRLAKLDESRVQQTSEVIARQVAHMTSLVDDLLDVSRVTRGLVHLEKSPLDVRHIVTEAVEQVHPLIRARRHHLLMHLSPFAMTVLGDRNRLVQVVANLLNNAAKFTPEGGHITVKTEVQDGEVLLSVADDGIGMEPELANRAFELFAQAERTPDRSSGGLGLGLALVKSLVELQGGTVTCSSEGLGKGSTFTVCLPLAGQQAGASDSDDTHGAPGSPASPLRVTVVDDNTDAAAMLALLLEASGHEVTVEQRPLQALEHSRTQPSDVYLLDIGLPEMDGNDLARRLRAQKETAQAVLVAVTGYGQEHDRRASMAAGFSYHLVKPVRPADLRNLLAEVSSRRPAS